MPLPFHLIRSINKVTLATPLALVATAILTKHRRGFQFHELAVTIKILLKFLDIHKIPIATTLVHSEKAIEETLSLLLNRKVISVIENVDKEETFYFVDEEKKLELEYYKNSIIHYFISHAFVAVSLLRGTRETKSNEEIPIFQYCTAALVEPQFTSYTFDVKFLHFLELCCAEENDPTTLCHGRASIIGL